MEAARTGSDPALLQSAVRKFRERSKANGYRLIPLRSRSKQPAGKNWQQGADAERLERVREDELNTGILAAGLRCLDMDVDDPEIAAAIKKEIQARFPCAIIRTRANSHRFAAVVRPAAGEPGKRSITGSSGKVEILGAGQQFVAHGVHPSGEPYAWENGRGPDTVPRDQLPTATEDEIHKLLTACAPLLGPTDVATAPATIANVFEQPFTTSPMVTNNTGPVENELGAGIGRLEWFDWLKAEEKSSLVRASLNAIDNRTVDPREPWLNAIFAVADAGRRGCHDARELALGWSRRGCGWTSEADFDMAWNSAKPGGIGVGTLLAGAKRAGLDLTPWRNLALARLQPGITTLPGPATSVLVQDRRAVHAGALVTATSSNNGHNGFERSLTGAIKRSYGNAVVASRLLGIVARRNTFSDKIILSNAPGRSTLPAEYEGLLSDHALTLIRQRIQEIFGFDPSKDHLLDAIKALAEDARFDPVNDWLDSLTWDGTRRFGSWLPAVTGAPATPLFKAAGATLLLGMVARARFPGTKLDLCPVLEGEQGCGKSSLTRALSSGPGEGYFCDAPGLIAMENKTRGEIISGMWIVELAELSGLARSETEGVKAFLSQSSDQYRPAYAAVAIERPRACVFVASTNASTYLTDSTGNRRFLPIPCKEIDIGAFLADRDQLFAEAVQIVDSMTASAGVKRGRPLPHALAVRFGLDPKHWAAAAQLTDARRVTDPVEDLLPSVVQSLETSARTLPTGQKFIPSSDLLATLRARLNAPVKNNGLATWMKGLGWSASKMGSGRQQVRGYAK